MNRKDILIRRIKLLFILVVFELVMFFEAILSDTNIYDINGDDKVDVNDVISLQRYINKHNIKEYDEEFTVQYETDEDGTVYVIVNGE